MARAPDETLTLRMPAGTAADIHRLLGDAAKYHDETRETTNAFIVAAINREITRRTKLRSLVDKAVAQQNNDEALEDLNDWLADIGEECASYVVFGADDILNPKPADVD